jgi:hypothetical protein
MSLVTSLSSSSFFLSDYLTKRINNNNYNEGQFSYALKKLNVSALIVQEAKAKSGSDNWLYLNQQLGKSQSISALKLARWYQNALDKRADVAEKLVAIMWYEQAIRLNSEEAIIELAQLYFDQGKSVIAEKTLGLLGENLINVNLNEKRLILSIKIAVYFGNITFVEELVSSYYFHRNKGEKTEDLLEYLIRYSIIPDKKAANSNLADRDIGLYDVKKQSKQAAVLSSDCISSLQLFATNLTHLKHLEHIIETFNVQQPLAQYICLPTPKYISSRLIDCVAEVEEPISCNESHWLNIAEKVNTRHVGLMLAKGGANVHLGMLYFDVDDDVNVFSHEISHLFGFVDEYPLVQSHIKCQSAQQTAFSHNIVVLNDYYQGEQEVLRMQILKNVPWASQIKDSTPILQPVGASLIKNNVTAQRQWRLGTPVAYREKIGLHNAESCDNVVLSTEKVNRYSAYKPVSRRTQLRYYASDFPKEYLSMLEERPQGFLMPSFHYNIALALFQQGNINKAKRLLIQSQRWEGTSYKKFSDRKRSL